MNELLVYLTFSGNCEEALNFYKEAIGGEIATISRFGDSQMEVSEEYKNKIMHSEFKSGKLYFMASDTMEGNPVIIGSNISLSIDFNSIEEQEKTFNGLSNGGTVLMPLQDQFWGARFGMCMDKYGFKWMFNCDKK